MQQELIQGEGGWQGQGQFAKSCAKKKGVSCTMLYMWVVKNLGFKVLQKTTKNPQKSKF